MSEVALLPAGSVASWDERAPSSPNSAPAVFETSHVDEPIDKVDALRRMSAISGRDTMALVKEFVALGCGRGRISFKDYINYRLFDDTFIGAADKSAFIGRRRNQDLVAEINYRHEWNCLSDDKIVNASYLSSYGLPVIPTKAIYAPHMCRGGQHVLRTPADLRAFLSDPANYPMFGKPTFGFQSLGSLVLKSLETDTGAIDISRATVSIDAVADAIDANFRDGYLFQPQLSIHTDLAHAIGPGLSTVRIITIVRDDGPQLFAAAWKIISGDNVADNYWRSGNILAALDPRDGRVRRAVTGQRFEIKEIDYHPTTGAALKDLALPFYAAAIDVALEGHRTLRDIGMIGWDIGITDDGPVIVEMNVMPDLLLVQAAHCSGAYNQELTGLLARQKVGAKAHEKAMRATLIRD